MQLAVILLQPFLPFMVEWIHMEEARILQQGRGLSADERDDARKAGVARPEMIRVLCVKEIEPPKGAISWIVKKAKVFSRNTKGWSLRYGILIRSDCENYQSNRLVYLHEFVHVGQYERYRSVDAFLYDYIRECANPGYPFGPLEKQAHRIATKILLES